MLTKNFKKVSLFLLAFLIAFVVIGCKKDDKVTNEEILKQAKANIMLDGKYNTLTDNLLLQEKTFYADNKQEIDIPIEWSASESQHFEIKDLTVKENNVDVTRKYGVPSRPEAGQSHAEVTLTATIKYNGVTTTRDWKVFVLAMPTAIVASISEVKSAAIPLKSVVQVTATVVTIVGTNGMIVKDETGEVYVYAGTLTLVEGMGPGAVVKVTGGKDVYNTMPQIGLKPTIELVTAAPEAGFDFSVAQEATVGDVVGKEKDNSANYGKIYNVTGEVIESYKVMVDGAEQTVSDYAIKDLKTNKVLAIYNSSSKEVKEQLKAKVGQYITITVVVYDFHSKQLVWRALGVENTIVDAEAPELTDAKKVENTIADLKTKFTEGMEVTAKLDLVTSNNYEGVTIAWTVTPEGIIATDGTFTMPSVDTDVTLTALVQAGEVSETLTVVVKAKALTNSTVAQIKTKDNSTPVMLEGVVTHVVSKGVFVQDANNDSIYVYINATPAANVKPGAVVKVTGTKTMYFSMPQVGNASVEVLTAAPETGYDYAALAVTSIENAIAPTDADLTQFAKLYKVKGTVIKDYKVMVDDKEVTVSNYAIKDEAGKILAIYNSSSSDLKAKLESCVGLNVEIVVLAYDFHSTQKVWRFYGVDGTVVLDTAALTADQKLDIEFAKLAANFVADMPVNADMTLPTAGVTFTDIQISWTATPEGVIAADGKFTAPAEDADVTLTATLTLGDATKTFSVVVKAKAPVAPVGGEPVFVIDFESATAVTSYLDNTVQTIDGKEYKLHQGLIRSGDANDRFNNMGLRLRGSSTVTPHFEMNFDLENISHFTMHAAFYGTHFDPRYTVEKSVDGGTTWTKVAENVEPYKYATVEQDYDNALIRYDLNETGNVRIRISVTSSITSNKSICFDDFKFYANEAE